MSKKSDARGWGKENKVPLTTGWEKHKQGKIPKFMIA